MSANERLFGVHGTALVLRSQRLMMLASNIANAATPGYKARDMDFAAALDAARAGQPMRTAVENSVSYRVPTTPSLDGNTVELATEQTLFTENALQYRASLAFLDSRISTLRRALKGE
jgi:flagellar basal-body rod protein FlgB